MREQFGVLALGQAGGNIGREFEKLGFTAVYVNSSQSDLATINGAHKIHIPNADGAARDRKKVLQLASEHIMDIVDKITTILTHKYIICTFSSSGGTGSGLSTPLMTYLTQIGRICIPAIVLPDDKAESAKACENAFNTCVEIMNIKNLGAAFLLDNARYDKFAINSRFAKELDAFINLKNDSIYGVIDPAERKQMLSCSGVSVLAKLSKSRSTASDILDALHNGIYAEITSKSAMYFALSTSNRSLDITDITREFQGVYDSYFGISDATSVAMISGLQFPNKILNKFRIKFEETVKNMNGGNFIQDFAPLEPLKGLSFTREQVTPTSPRDLLMGLLNG
jgi:cell division GTPase FtsZ